MRISALSLVTIVAFSAPAFAQNISSTNPQSLADALAQLGHNPELTTDPAGDPYIAAPGDGGPYSIWFYGCTNGAGCTAINVSAGYDLPDGSTPEQMNTWNAGRLMGRAFLDDEADPYLDQYLVMGGGVTLLTFAQFINEWDRALAEFNEFIDF